MRIVQLTESEAANSAVMENVALYLLTGEPVHVTGLSTTDSYGRIDASALDSTNKPLVPAPVPSVPLPPATIGQDAPDVGVEQPVVPLASPFANLGFGNSLPASTPLSMAGVPSVPSPVTAPAVSAPSVGASLAHAGVELDKNGLYWDERIHSSSKDKNKDETWRAKRGVDKALVPIVEAEIRAILAIPSGVAPPAVPTPPAAAVPQVPSVPLPPAGTTVATTPVPAAPAADEHAFTRWMEELAPEMAPGGRFTPDLLTKLIVVQGLDPALGLMVYTKRQDLVPAAREIVLGWMNNPATVPQ